MSYTVVQKIRGKYYLYEVTEARWDPSKKNSKQTRRYIGPCDKDGNIDESRRKTTDQKGATGETRVYWTKNMGQYHLLNVLAERSGIKSALRDAFGDELAADILVWAMLRIAQPCSLRNQEETAVSTYARELLGTDSNYGSQRMSENMRLIGKSEHSRMTYNASMTEGSETIVFDTTALFSSSKLFDMLEYGRKYRKSGLPQTNLGFVHSLDRGFPVHYRSYPGNISDSMMIVNLAEELKGMGSNVRHAVLDRGFYSENNIRTMYASGIGFTFPVPSGKSIFKSALSNAAGELDNPENMFRFRGRTESAADSLIEMPFEGILDRNGVPVKELRVIVFQNSDRRKDEIDVLMERIDALEVRASSTPYSADGIADLFAERNGELRTFFDVSERNGMTALRRKRNAISFAMRMCGRMVVLTTSDSGPKEVLGLYRLRDQVEKDYEALKDDMDGGIRYVRDTVSAHGMIFVQFVATQLRMYMMNEASKNDHLDRLGIPKILKLLNCVTVSKVNDRMFISEMGKKQKDVFDAFGVDIPAL